MGINEGQIKNTLTKVIGIVKIRVSIKGILFPMPVSTMQA